MVGVCVGGILGKRNHKLHTGFFLFQIKKGTSRLTNMAILRKKGTLGSQWQSLINSPVVTIIVIVITNTSIILFPATVQILRCR